MTTLSVIKRDNNLQDFDTEKIKAGIVKAGANEEVAAKVAKNVEEDVSRVAAASIRDKVVRLLKIENPDVAAKFEAFKKA